MKTSLRNANIGSLLTAAATLAIIGMLAQHGPFFDPWARGGKATVSARYLAGDGRILTIAGAFDAARDEFKAADSEGVLVFGPYVSLEAGRYSVSWRGSAQKDSQPRFEISSMKDGLIARGEARVVAGTADATLQTMEFSTAQPIEGAEFRVLVGRDDAVAVRAVELTALAITAVGAHE